MKVVEQFLAAKSGVNADCQDGIVVTDHYAAVIDGATDKTRARYDGMPGGQFAMRTCVQMIRELAHDADAKTATAQLTAALAERLPADVDAIHRPSAVFAIYSRTRRELWRVGDVSFWHEPLPIGGDMPRKLVDHHASGVRSALLAAELAAGRTLADLQDDDIGRAAILTLLRRQSIFVNNPDAGEWAYGAVNGQTVPGSFIEVHDIPTTSNTLVIATDGYPSLRPTLAESEAHLRHLLAEDPLCIGPLRGTKGVAPGADSFDDRAYLRLAV